MKKVLALLLALVMVASLAACGGAAQSSAAPAESQAASSEEAKPEETPAPTEAPESSVEEGSAVEQEEKASDDIITVTYFCTIGAYLELLVNEIDKWNAGEGKEKGVYIEVTSNINDGSSAIEAQMQAGNHWDMMDGGTNQAWVLQGWVKDLNEIDDPDLKALIESDAPYFTPQCTVGGKLVALPLEAVPLKLAVNVDLFEKSGLEYPKTWDEFIACAKKITEDNPGTAWGLGGTTWSAFYRRLFMKSMSASLEKNYWDPTTGTYSFGQYKPIMDGLRELYAEGCILGMDDLAIDPIRAEFAAGKVGMFPAPAYDWSVYTNQFPAECNWTIIDMPTLGDKAEYKGSYIPRVNNSIDQVNWDAADDAKKAAIVDAYVFLNSDALNSTIYANAGIIPLKPEIAASTDLVITQNQEQWAIMSDLTNYAPEVYTPDGMLPLEGDKFPDVFSQYLHGDIDDWDALVADLDERYNAAWAEAVEDPDIDTDRYLYDYSHNLD